MIKIVNNTIDLLEVLESVADDSAGGIDIFIGTTRDNAAGKNVLFLEYESYEEMALEIMNNLFREAMKRWDLCNVSIVHRLGRVSVGEASIVIAVSAPHRKEAFEACRFLIDALKTDVPIWKKEYFEDGEVWVDSRK